MTVRQGGRCEGGQARKRLGPVGTAGVLLLLTPLGLLLGCPKDQGLGAPPAQATAPTLGAATAQMPATSAKAGASAAAKVAPTGNLAAATETSAPVHAPEDPAHAARVQAVILAAEQNYASGVQNYQAKRLQAAKVDFDAAVDGLLMSGLDVKADPALADEMDRLLNAVNSLEMAALKQGNGFAQSAEEAPLSAANDVTFAPDAALTAKVQGELKTTQSDLPLVVNDYVTGFIRYYTSNSTGHAHLLRSLERAGKYREMISKDLAAAGVPQDLIYLAVAESGFQPQVVNGKYGAGGMWQFLPTGAYGLTRNGWFDERFDPEKSSKAYAKYMKTLYNQFGDWYLAMAAYDWGPGNIQRAVMKTGYADFWELYRRGVLPGETKNYVPGIIAAAIMAKNPDQYGLANVHPMAPVIYDTVQTETSVDLRLVGDVTGVSESEIVTLNPSLLRSTTPRDMSFDLHIPPGTKELYDERMKEIPEEHRATWRFHVVRPGETMEGIATAMRARPVEIAEANGLRAGEAVAPGDELVVPITPAVSVASGRLQHYTVRRGDTLVTVADRYNVSVEDLRSWNRLKGNAVQRGKVLVVSEPVRLAPTGRARAKSSRVKRGAAAREHGGASGRASATGKTRGAAGAKKSGHATGGSAGKKRAAAKKSAATKSAATKKSAGTTHIKRRH